MSMPRTALAAAVAALLSLSIAACSRDAADAPATADASATPDTPVGAPISPSDPALDGSIAQPEPIGECNADAAQALVGQEATDALVEQARVDSGSESVRVLAPGDAATMDFRPDRLNIDVNDVNVIQSLRCG